LICIFIFVKTANDIYVYGLLMVLGMLISQLMLWPFVPKYVKIKRVTFSEIKNHLIPNLTLFIPVIAISLYTIMDKVMLGALSTMTEVG
ncbi:oligosaccharide flippase family protein, partial [[Ruminococcus] gnavus]